MGTEEGDDAADDDGALGIVGHVQEDLRQRQQHDHHEHTRHQARYFCETIQKLND